MAGEDDLCFNISPDPNGRAVCSSSSWRASACDDYGCRAASTTNGSYGLAIPRIAAGGNELCRLLEGVCVFDYVVSWLRMKIEHEISWTEPNRTVLFFYLIRSNSHFLVRFYCFRFRIPNIKVKNSLDIFRSFSTFLFLIRKYPEFKIWFKLNLVADHYCSGN
jgi:hypothetical protein